jgi:hypothetical protein
MEIYGKYVENMMMKPFLRDYIPSVGCLWLKNGVFNLYCKSLDFSNFCGPFKIG